MEPLEIILTLRDLPFSQRVLLIISDTQHSVYTSLVISFPFKYVIHGWFSGVFLVSHPEGQQNAFLRKTSTKVLERLLRKESTKHWTDRQETCYPWFCSEFGEGTLSRAFNLPLFLSSAIK